MEPLIAISVILSFFSALIAMPFWIRKCKNIDFLWEDMNKYSTPRNVAASGGIVVVMSFVIGVLAYIAIITFIFGQTDGTIIKIFSALSVILMLALVGLADDFLGWKKGGLSWKFRIFLAFVASIPLIVINAGYHTMDFPFLGLIDFGLMYPLVLVPLGIAGATTTYNFLAGFNGLETGQGIIILSFLSLISYLTGNSWLTIIGIIMVASLAVFYVYNKFPARVFPGNILTWSIGALIAIMAILGNFEKIAVFVFIPYIAETILKVRGNLKKQSFGIPEKDNSLKMPYDKIYGMTHLSIFILQKFKEKVYEKDVVWFIYTIQLVFVGLGFLIFRNSIF